MTLAVLEIGRINQRDNLEGIHNDEEESISLSLAPRDMEATFNTLCSHLAACLSGAPKLHVVDYFLALTTIYPI